MKEQNNFHNFWVWILVVFFTLSLFILSARTKDLEMTIYLNEAEENRQNKLWHEECFETHTEQKFRIVDEIPWCIEYCDRINYCTIGDDGTKINCNIDGNKPCYSDCVTIMRPYVEYYNETTCIKYVKVRNV